MGDGLNRHRGGSSVNVHPDHFQSEHLLDLHQHAKALGQHAKALGQHAKALGQVPNGTQGGGPVAWIAWTENGLDGQWLRMLSVHAPPPTWQVCATPHHTLHAGVHKGATQFGFFGTYTL